jgi:hypothetical protein
VIVSASLPQVIEEERFARENSSATTVSAIGHLNLREAEWSRSQYNAAGGFVNSCGLTFGHNYACITSNRQITIKAWVGWIVNPTYHAPKSIYDWMSVVVCVGMSY